MRAQPGGDLTFEVNAVALPGSGDRALVPLVVEIDGAALLDRGQGVLGRVEIYAYAIDPAGKIGDFLVQAFTLDAEKLGEVLWQSGPRFQGNLHLAPGDYQLRILVRESQSKAAGLRELPLKIAGAGGGRRAARRGQSGTAALRRAAHPRLVDPGAGGHAARPGSPAGVGGRAREAVAARQGQSTR